MSYDGLVILSIFPKEICLVAWLHGYSSNSQRIFKPISLLDEESNSWGWVQRWVGRTIFRRIFLFPKNFQERGIKFLILGLYWSSNIEIIHKISLTRIILNGFPKTFYPTGNEISDVMFAIRKYRKILSDFLVVLEENRQPKR